MRRTITAVAACLLLAGCSSATASRTTAPTPAPSSGAATTTAAPPPHTAAAPPATPQTVVGVRADRLPYLPAPGAPKLDDVTYQRTATNPCQIPADDSGNEAQLLDAQVDVNVLVVTYEFTNPCTKPLAYRYTLTEHLDSVHGRKIPGGSSGQSPVIQPGKSIKFHFNADYDQSLSQAELQRLWIGVTHLEAVLAP